MAEDTLKRELHTPETVCSSRFSVFFEQVRDHKLELLDK